MTNVKKGIYRLCFKKPRALSGTGSIYPIRMPIFLPRVSYRENTRMETFLRATSLMSPTRL